MSKGFRKSLFGFNTTDVLAFIAASDKAAKLKTDELNAKISELESKVKTLEEQNLELVAKNAEYESKKEQIRVMSENVARMYLSAKTTSQLWLKKLRKAVALLLRKTRNSSAHSKKQTSPCLPPANKFHLPPKAIARA